MSDDEGGRRLLPLMGVAALSVVLGVGWYFHQRTQRSVQAMAAFCSATHGGEPWAHARARALERDYQLTLQSAAGVRPEQWLVWAEFMSRRVGCAVTVADGRVVKARSAELPRQH